MKNNKAIFWIIGLGGLAYAAYKMFYKGKYKGKSEENTDIKVPDVNPKTGEKYSDYDKSVMTLQTLLAAKVDAMIGPQTISLLKELYLGTLKYGDISPLNVEKYIAEVKNKTTPYNLKMKAEAYADANAKSKEKIIKIIEQYRSDEKLVLNFNPANAVNGVFQVYKVVYNTANKDWERVGTENAMAGRKTRDGGVAYSYSQKWNALIVRINKSGKYMYVAINPDFVQVIY
jgi:hypothetical protein